jgi:FMN reductase [NAD(P)H]
MTNSIIQQMLNRRSIRNFTGEHVKDADLQLILQAAQQAPSSINSQQVTLVVTRDKATIQKIAEIAGGQPQVATADVFITVVMDFNRTHEACHLAGQTQVIERSAEALVAGAVDAGIMLQAIQMAADSLGYGTTPIGGIRRDPQAMIDLLKLPARTYPLVGTTIGVPDAAKRPQVKPRVPLASFALDEVYSQERVAAGVKSYDATLRQWWDAQGMTQMPSYVESTAGFYKMVYFPKVAETLRRQGFEFGDSV